MISGVISPSKCDITFKVIYIGNNDKLIRNLYTVFIIEHVMQWRMFNPGFARVGQVVSVAAVPWNSTRPDTSSLSIPKTANIFLNTFVGYTTLSSSHRSHTARA